MWDWLQLTFMTCDFENKITFSHFIVIFDDRNDLWERGNENTKLKHCYFDNNANIHRNYPIFFLFFKMSHAIGTFFQFDTHCIICSYTYRIILFLVFRLTWIKWLSIMRMNEKKNSLKLMKWVQPWGYMINQ